MTKKDFELIARVFAEHNRRYGGRTSAVAGELAQDFATELAETNPLFDRARFLAACEGRTKRAKEEYVNPPGAPRPRKVQFSEVSTCVGRETVECAAMVDGYRVHHLYSGYTELQAKREFVRAVNAGEIVNA